MVGVEVEGEDVNLTPYEKSDKMCFARENLFLYNETHCLL